MRPYTINFDQGWETVIATTGLKGLPGLEQLDRLGLSSPALIATLTAIGLLAGMFITAISGSVNIDSPLSTYYTDRVMGISMLAVCGGTGFTLALNIILARTTEADLQSLSERTDLTECIAQLTPRLAVFGPIMVLIVLLTTFAGPLLASQRLEISLYSSLLVFSESGDPAAILTFVLWPIGGLAWGTGFGIGITQILALTRTARTIEIDLFQLGQYTLLANPTIRVVIIVFTMISLFPLVGFFINDPVATLQINKLMIGSLLIVLPALIAWFLPIFILRNRIRDKKTEELETLLRVIQGDEAALMDSCIPKREGPVTTADLLTHQLFIESRWDWPIASQVHKLLMFGLLPPLTWFLAALIESLFF